MSGGNGSRGPGTDAPSGAAPGPDRHDRPDGSDLDAPRSDAAEALARPWIFEVDPDVAQPGSMEARASLAFKAIAAIDGFAIVLALFPSLPPAATFLTVAFNVAALLLVVVCIVEAVGLDRGADWAIAAIRPLLVLILLAGVALMIIAFMSGRIRVPFDVAIAGWALLSRPSLRRPWRPDWRTFALVGGASLALTGMLVARPLFDWGGWFDVHEADLQAALTVDCAGPGAGADAGTAAGGPSGGGLPDALHVSFDWSWTSTSLFPSGADAVVLGWDGDDATGRPLYLIGSIPLPPEGVYQGMRAYPSVDLANEAAQATRSHWFWGVLLEERGFAPGRLELVLERWVKAPPDPEPLVISASYVHAGVWRQDVAPVTCAW